MCISVGFSTSRGNAYFSSATCHVVMLIYRLPHGKYAYSGHILNLPQDVNSFVKNLPCSPSDLDVIIVRKEGAAESHKDFRVRQPVVLYICTAVAGAK